MKIVCSHEKASHCRRTSQYHGVECLSGFVSQCIVPIWVCVRGPRALDVKRNTGMLCNEEWNHEGKELKTEASLSNRLYLLGLCFSGVVEKELKPTGSWTGVFCIFFFFGGLGVCCWFWYGEAALTPTHWIILCLDRHPHCWTTLHLLAKVWTIPYIPRPGLLNDKGIQAYLFLNKILDVSELRM